MVVQLWVLITRQAGFMSGLPPLAGGIMCVWLTSKLLRRMSPPFGALVAKQAGTPPHAARMPPHTTHAHAHKLTLCVPFAQRWRASCGSCTAD